MSACSVMFLRARGRELAGVLDHRLERAVLRDQLAGGLVADAGDARDVVGGVALQPDEVRHLLGRHAVARLDALRRVDVDVGDAARRHHQADVLAAELERVAVGRDDARLDPLAVGARRERRDHVVRLPALELEVAVAERLDDRAEVRELLAQQVRHRLAALLVDHVGRLGDRRAMHRPRVPRDRYALRPVVGEQLEEHVREAEQRVRRLAIRRRELLRQGEERAVGEVVAVDDEEVALARRRRRPAPARLRSASSAQTPRVSSARRCRSLEIHPLSELRGEAAALLAERYARQRAAEPLLPEVDDFEPHVCRTTGHVATRGGEAVAYLARRGRRRRRDGAAGCSPATPRASRRRCATSSRTGGGVRRVALHAHRPRHRPRADRRLVPARVRLPGGVGRARGRAVREPVEFGGIVRPATPDDTEAFIDFDARASTGTRAQRRASRSSRCRRRATACAPRVDESSGTDDAYVPFVAERDGRVVGPARPLPPPRRRPARPGRTTSTSHSPRRATRCAAPAPGSRSRRTR